MITIGFTGSRHGQSVVQLATLNHIWRFGDPPAEDFTLVHGSCKGSDEAAHRIAVDLGWKTRLRPTYGPWRANLAGDEVFEPEAALWRNNKIVKDSNMLYATPDGPETMRSGTWYTIRKARELGVNTTIIMPDGSVYLEEYAQVITPRLAEQGHLFR